MEYLVKWKDKIKNEEHFLVVRDYGAVLLGDLLRENGYEFEIKETPVLNKNYKIPEGEKHEV